MNNDIQDILNHIDPQYEKTIHTPETWHPHIIECHKQLKNLDPQYTIYQIKEKFNELRYYFHTTQPDKHQQMNQIVNQAIKKIHDEQ